MTVEAVLFSVVPVIELYPELEAVLEVVDPALVNGVGFRMGGGGLGLLVVLVWLLFIMFRPRVGRPLTAAVASVWLLLLFEAEAEAEADEVAEVVGGALGDLCAAAALIIIRRVSSALLGWW